MLGIVKHRNIWFALSGAVIIASIVFLALWGVRLGIDFTGGSLLEVRWTGDVPAPSSLRETLDPILEREFVAQPTDANGMVFRMEDLSEERHQEVLNTLQNAGGEIEELRFESIGPTIGKELAKKSFWALLIVFVAIMLYIAFAFRKVSEPVSSWKYGFITIVAGLHDVIIPLGLFAILGKLFGSEVNAAFVAAILTVLGYSINDTIVVLDRIRENLAKKFSPSFEETIELSVNQTIARSLNTSITTLLVLLAVFFFGGTTIHDFVLVLIVGIIAGAYSSIFIASPLLVVWNRMKK